MTTITINDLTPRDEYTATASQTTFVYNFSILADTDLKVFQTASGATPDDTTDILTLTTHYTVTDAGVEDGGTIVLVTGATVNDKIVILRDIPIDRTAIDYQANGDIESDTLNTDVDRAVLHSQQNESRIENETITFKRSESRSANTNKYPTPVDGKYLTWTNGDLVNTDGPTGAVTLTGQGADWNNAIGYTKNDLVKDSLENYHTAKAAHSGSDPTTDTSRTNWRTLPINLPRKNALLNARFNVNQQGLSGTVSLSAGEYGHDRFRGGSAGCTYTFVRVGSVTTLTISAGTIEQEINGLNISGGTNVLSWTGTSQGRIDGGTYGNTGAVTSVLTGAANAICEWNTGTLTECQLEQGSTSTVLEAKTDQEDIKECQFYGILIPESTLIGFGFATSATSARVNFYYPKMRIDPSLTVLAGTVQVSSTSVVDSSGTVLVTSPGVNSTGIIINGLTGYSADLAVDARTNAGCTIYLSAEIV